MQSELKTRLDLLPANALIAEGVVLAEGAEKYEPWNWLKIPIEDHINHAMVHLTLAANGDTSENHLAHAACRVHFALELQERISSHKVDIPEKYKKTSVGNEDPLVTHIRAMSPGKVPLESHLSTFRSDWSHEHSGLPPHIHVRGSKSHFDGPDWMN